jgi:energy-coupling factor transport system permease protein
LAEAQRCRPGAPATRLQLLRASTAGLLDRALDVAAALEVRGYGAARRPPAYRRPYSRHDLAFLASASIVVGLSVAARVAGLDPLQAYPVMRVPLPGSEIGLAAGLLAAALIPFAERRGIVR